MQRHHQLIAEHRRPGETQNDAGRMIVPVGIGSLIFGVCFYAEGVIIAALDAARSNPALSLTGAFRSRELGLSAQAMVFMTLLMTMAHLCVVVVRLRGSERSTATVVRRSAASASVAVLALAVVNHGLQAGNAAVRMLPWEVLIAVDGCIVAAITWVFVRARDDRSNL